MDHPERIENVFCKILMHRFPGYCFNDQPQQLVSCITVMKPFPRREMGVEILLRPVDCLHRAPEPVRFGCHEVQNAHTPVRLFLEIVGDARGVIEKMEEMFKND